MTRVSGRRETDQCTATKPTASATRPAPSDGRLVAAAAFFEAEVVVDACEVVDDVLDGADVDDVVTAAAPPVKRKVNVAVPLTPTDSEVVTGVVVAAGEYDVSEATRTQLELDAIGCADGVTGSPWENVEDP